MRLGLGIESDARRSRLPELLAGTAIGIYVLVVLGATTALLDGGAACHTWPACSGEWLVSPGDPIELVVAWGHRVLTMIVGAMLMLVTGLAWRWGCPRRVRVCLAGVSTLYPLQIALGAVTAVRGATTALAAGHLAAAMVIFAGVLLALLWQLETESNPGAEVDPSAGHASDSTAPGPDQSIIVSSKRPAGPLATAQAYLELTKPKLWWLLCLVALAAMALAAGPDLALRTAVATVVGGILAIGASGTFNNVIERDVDRRMARTADRPVATATVPPRRAMAFGLFLSAASMSVFVGFVNLLAAALAVIAILFYTVGYTIVLKPNTDQNIVLGGAVGAFPALIGWAAVTDTVGIPAIVLGGVIFLWTPAHFYNLALIFHDDYERAGFPMLPVVRGEAVTRRHILGYLGATLLGAVALGASSELGWVYALVVITVGGTFLWSVIGLFRRRTTGAAWRAFHASNGFLGFTLLAVFVDAVVI